MTTTPTAANDNTPQRPAEFGKAIEELLPKLHFFARRLTTRDPEDLVQETVALALHRWSSYREEHKLISWLMFLMRECAYQMRRKRGVISDMTYEKPVAPNQEDAADASLAVEAVMRLRESHQNVLFRLALGDRKCEIAHEKGVSQQAVDDHIKRARKQLHKAMRGQAKKPEAA